MAKTLMIRNLSRKDNRILNKLKERLYLSSCSKVLMQAAYSFMEHTGEIERLQNENAQLKETINQLTEVASGIVYHKKELTQNEKRLGEVLAEYSRAGSLGIPRGATMLTKPLQPAVLEEQ